MKVSRVALLLGIVLSALAALAPPAGAANQTVTATLSNQFIPASVAILPNETVTWTNAGGAHNVRFEDNMFVQPPAPSTDAWTVSRPFSTLGTYPYYCEVHGAFGGLGMSGTVVVGEADVTPPTSTALAPANSASASFVIPYTASDGTGSGVAEVELWGKGPGDTEFFLENTDTTPDSPTFDYTATLGNGTYEFYTRAVDIAGNYEDAPATPDSVTVLNIPDPDPPISSASAPASSTSNFFDIGYTADGTGSGVVEVELWGKGPGDLDYVYEGSDTTPESPAFNYIAILGDGTYEFYTRAYDSAGNYEAAPAVPDTATVVNTAPPPRPITTPPAPAPIATTGAPKDISAPVMTLASKKATLARTGTIQVRLSCPASEPGGCRGRLSLATLGKRKVRLGSASFRIGGGKTAGVKVRLTKRNQRLLKKLRKARVRATINARDAAGNAATRNHTLSVTARR